MKVAVVGTGYVGLIQAACLAELGNDVTCLDIDEAKIEGLKHGKSPIYEPGIEELVAKNVDAGRLHFTTDYATAIPGVDVAFIAVGTPSRDDGRADLQYVEAAARSIAKHLDGYAVVVNKSTVPVGTGDVVSDIVREEYKGEFDVASNPEFLREGSAIDDFMHPDRVVVGNASEKAKEILEALYQPLGSPILFTDIKTAEMIKYASNSMLATQISFINSIAQICDNVGADVTKVSEGMKLDGRIGKRSFLNAGVGYGGSCFPKDVKALVQIAHDHGVHFEILEAVEDVNAMQRRTLVQKVRTLLGDVKGTRIAIWGLAFKPKTDDLRYAPALDVAQMLMTEGATVVAFDPVAGDGAKNILTDLELADSPLATTKDADALVIMTEWDEFKEIDLAEVKSALKQPKIVDGRNLYELDTMRELGFDYVSVGRPIVHAK